MNVDEALPAMQALASRLTPDCWQHPGQLAWSARYALPEDLDHGPVTVAEVGGEVVAWAWQESADWLEWCADPSYTGAAEHVLAWFVARTTGPVRTQTLETEPHLVAALGRGGFVVEPAAPYFTQHTLDLADLAPVPEIDGYELRAMRPDETAARAACHRDAWSPTSKVSTAAYARLAATPPYRHALDHVAVAPDGAMVASCLAWYDAGSGTALVEPVGCHPDHRRRGLAGAVSLSALHAARAAGARVGLVRPRGDDDHPEPQRVYRRIGFVPGARTRQWLLDR